MSKKKYFDFDAAMEERDNGSEPFIVKAFGQEYKLPGSIPFDIILKVQRMQAEGKAETGMDDLMEMCNAIFGKKAFEEWRANGISIAGIELLIKTVMETYMDDAQDQAAQSARSKHETIKKP